MRVVISISQPILLALSLLLVMAYPLHADEAEVWTDDDGLCSTLELGNLQEKYPSLGASFVNKTSQIFQQGRRNSRPTNSRIPSLTKVQCHAEINEKIFITTDAITGKYCGWVEKDNLIKGSTEGFMSDGSHCGIIEPIKITDYCLLMKTHEQFPPGCSISALSSSVIDTKFITDNTSKAIEEGKEPSKKIDIYKDVSSNQVQETIDIFTVLQVFDVKASKGNSNKLRYLVGPRDGDIRGWISQHDGKIWYSKLAAYFSENGEEGIYRYPIGTQEAVQEQWSPHPGSEAIARTVYGVNPFSRYPILFDHRKKQAKDGVHKKPHLEISYIAKTCGNAGSPIRYCPGSGIPSSSVVTENIIRTDILFLVDGTKSMKPYFGLVADVVKKFSKDKVGNSNFRIGVSMYGDYLDKAKRCVECAMQYRDLRGLRPIRSIFEFDQIRQSELYIADELGDKSEAVGSALFRASNSNWKRNALRVIIHIGDHGDRHIAKEAVLSSLMQNKVIYLPIAVRGEKFFPVENRNFIDQGNYIQKKHGIYDGQKFVPLSSKTEITYDPQSDENRNVFREEEAIANAFVTGMDLAKKMAKQFVEDSMGKIKIGRTLPQLGDEETSIVNLNKNIFCQWFKDHPNCKQGGTVAKFVKLVAVKGYIGTAELQEPEKNWDYFVALESSKILDLKTSFEKLCYSLGERSSPEIAPVVLRVIESLTGDQVERADLADYFKKKEAIPLVSETLLSGVRELDMAIRRDDRNKLKEYVKDYCRSATLLSMMLSSKIVKKPFDDMVTGGDLIWNEGKRKYSLRNQIAHNWYYKDIYDLGLYFVPLKYLPQKKN